jgi:glycine/D-amino acid oxidase-like deaminating enzyme
MRRSAALWRALEAESGERLFEQTGVVEGGPPDGFLVGGVRQAAALHDLPIENLTRAQFHERYPWFRLPKEDEAVFEAEAGYVLADKTVRAQTLLAERRGAVLHADDRTQGWTSRTGGIALKCDSGDYVVERLVVAAGVWAPGLLGATIAPVAPREKPLFWIGAGDESLTFARGFVPFAIETAEARMFYGFPAIDGDGVKVAEHTGGRDLASPEARTKATAEERAGVEAFLRDYAPGLPRNFGREETCLYELSPDQHFMIGRHPEEPRVVFAAGLSGHGFKFAPLIGEALADLAMGKPLSPEFDFLDPMRFSAGSRPSLG